MKIYVTDKTEKLHAGNNREELADYLVKTCSRIYMAMVLSWFDDGPVGPLVIKNGKEIDTWTVELGSEDFGSRLERSRRWLETEEE